MTHSAEILRPLVDLRDRTIQKSRIAFGNRVSAIEDGRDEVDPVTHDIIVRYLERFEQLEEEINEDIETIAADIPIIQEMVEVKGVGLMLASKIVAMIDIEQAHSVSALWRFAGYGVVPLCEECGTYLEVGVEYDECPECGGRVVHRAERLRKGEPAHFNTRLKTYCHQVGSSFLKSSSPYRSIYDKAREHYDLKRPEWPKNRKHFAAMRKMIKIFLQHLWVRWRSLENLPVSEPYILTDPKHTHYLTPEEFGWPEREPA